MEYKNKYLELVFTFFYMPILSVCIPMGNHWSTSSVVVFILICLKIDHNGCCCLYMLRRWLAGSNILHQYPKKYFLLLKNPTFYLKIFCSINYKMILPSLLEHTTGIFIATSSGSWLTGPSNESVQRGKETSSGIP